MQSREIETLLRVGEKFGVGDVNPVMVVTTLVVCLGAWLWWYVYWSQRLNVTPTEWPVIGLLVQLKFNWNRLHDWITGIMHKSHTIRVHVGFGFMAVVTVEPANVEHIMKTNFNNYPKVSIQLDFKTSCHVANLWTSCKLWTCILLGLHSSLLEFSGVVCKLNLKGLKVEGYQRRFLRPRHIQRRWRFVDSPAESGSH